MIETKPTATTTLYGSTLLSAFVATDLEWQAYAHYDRKIASVLGGPFDSDLWRRQILQIAYAEPTVRHGVFALGHLFRHDTATAPAGGGGGGGTHISSCVCRHCRRALRSYNKSISSLSQSLQSGNGGGVDVALASCALFICIELYRLNDDNVLSLTARGCAMLSAATTVNPRFFGLFERLRLLSASFGFPIPRPALLSLSTSETLEAASVEAARDSLYDIMTAVQASRVRAAQAHGLAASVSIPTVSEMQQERDEVVQRVRRWRRDWDRLFFPESTPSLARLILEVQYLKTKIYAETGLDLSQDCYDRYMDDFQRMADAAEQGLRLAPPEKDAPSFSFETCFLPSLYLAALKCRRPTLRRRLLGLMRLTNAKEGLWHRAEGVGVVSRVMELEEGRADFVPAGGGHDLSSLVGLPRFHDVACGINRHHDGKTMVDVVYILHVPSAAEPWQCMEETVVVDE
jgi:hypothetical protein